MPPRLLWIFVPVKLIQKQKQEHMQLLSIINISWQTYFSGMGCALLIYWIAIGGIYYSKEIKALLTGKRAIAKSPLAVASNPFVVEPEPAIHAMAVEDEPIIAEDDETPSAEFPLVYALADEVKTFISHAAGQKMIKQELAQGLHSLFLREPYIQVQSKAFRVAINNLVAVESEQQCGIEFTDQETEALWIR